MISFLFHITGAALLTTTLLSVSVCLSEVTDEEAPQESERDGKSMCHMNTAQNFQHIACPKLTEFLKFLFENE